jgi:hypothetical protein
MATNAAQSAAKTVADPLAIFEDLEPLWKKCRAVCGGQRLVKSYDDHLDIATFDNLLIPFSPSMSTAQYAFYRAEAELPGITAQFARMLVGGLLRKKPILRVPTGFPEKAQSWLVNELGQDESTLVSFLDDLLWEEIQTSRAWVYVDHPQVLDADDMSPEERELLKPYPVIWEAEFVINWRVSRDTFGRSVLDRVVTKGYVEKFDENEFHADYVETVWVHELDEAGHYRIRVFEREDKTQEVPIVNNNMAVVHDGKVFVEGDPIENIRVNGEPLDFIPAWPLNGAVEPIEPVLLPIVDKEVALYNKISRRNHLLYGAATYTPWIKSDMTDDEFDKAVEQGLGTWMRLQKDDEIGVLKAPSDALSDMDRSIVSSIEEMAKLGIRMLSPETAQSGVALQLRNASQTAQLGSLNNRVSSTMKQVFALLLNWRYDKEVSPSDIEFNMTEDFDQTPLGADWLRLATEWYQEGLIPRSVWLNILKRNDMIEPEYDDEMGLKEISDGLDVVNPRVDDGYADRFLKDGSG